MVIAPLHHQPDGDFLVKSWNLRFSIPSCDKKKRLKLSPVILKGFVQSWKVARPVMKALN